MNKVSRRRRMVQGTADTWPDWVDDYRWGVGPEVSDDDRQWHSDQNEGWHDQEGHPTDDEIDRWADESEAVSLMERGICPI